MQSLIQFLGKTLTVLALLLALGGGYYWYQQAHGPCVAPISYSIGKFDARFGVSQEDFISATKEAAAVWSKAGGKTLFTYSAQGDLPINLIYDSRQASTQQSQVLQGNIDNGKQVADSVQQQYLALKQNYQSAQNEYAVLLAAYNQELDAYNQQVSYWNEQGGAPKSEFAKLDAEKNSLNAARANLENKRLAINNAAQQINALIDQYNLVITHVNATVGEINKNAGHEFEEGEYVSDASGKRINVYEFQSYAKLVRLLAHEFGHALGLQHNDNPESIMYYLNQKTNVKPSADDIAALKSLCNIK